MFDLHWHSQIAIEHPSPTSPFHVIRSERATLLKLHERGFPPIGISLRHRNSDSWQWSKKVGNFFRLKLSQSPETRRKSVLKKSWQIFLLRKLLASTDTLKSQWETWNSSPTPDLWFNNQKSRKIFSLKIIPESWNTGKLCLKKVWKFFDLEKF